MKHDDSGFTLVELLLSVTIIGMLTALSLPVYNSFLARNDLDIASEQVAQTLRRAQKYARGMYDDSAWSIEVQSSTVTLFRGTTFASRNTGFDEPITLPSSITASGLSQVQFSKLSAAPNTTGTITLTNNNNETRTITINGKGMVNY